MDKIERVCLNMGGFEVNSYIVHAPKGDLIVDAGAEPQKILSRLTKPVTAILITHGHGDHVGALEEVRQKTRAPVYMHPEDAQGTGIIDYKSLEDGRELDLDGETIKVLHTPGHSPGSVTFVVGADQIVGDLVLPGSVGRTDISGGSWEQIEASVRKIMQLWGDSTRLYTGHGSVLHAMKELETNPYLPLGVL